MEIESVEKDPSEDFTLIKKIGCGHMSKVFLVVHRRSKKLYALKVMSKDVGRQGGAAPIRYASVEKDILSTLNHPFLPSLFTYFESNNHTFLAMKYCSGGDMNVLRLSQPNQTFSESAARFYAAEIILALEYLHNQGIVYRDLKPENVLVQDNGHIMLSDFDLSLRLSSRGQIPANDTGCPTKYDKFSNSRSNFNWRSDSCKVKGDFGSHNSKSDNSSPTEFRHSRSHSLVGTREYIAPEILWCTGHSFPVDWWAFGIFLYEMINGRTPFCGANRKETFFNIMCKDPLFAGPYSALQDLIKKLLVKEPSKRLGSLRGVEEVKDHEFFRGLRWDALEFVDRPPFLPFLTSAVEEIDSEIEDQSNESQEIETKKSLISDDEFSFSDKSTLLSITNLHFDEQL